MRLFWNWLARTLKIVSFCPIKATYSIPKPVYFSEIHQINTTERKTDASTALGGGISPTPVITGQKCPDKNQLSTFIGVGPGEGRRTPCANLD